MIHFPRVTDPFLCRAGLTVIMCQLMESLVPHSLDDENTCCRYCSYVALMGITHHDWYGLLPWSASHQGIALTEYSIQLMWGCQHGLLT